MRNAWLRSCVMASNAPAPNGLLDLSSQLRNGIVAAEPEPVLSGAVECDEVYIVAGHKGNPEAVKEKGRLGRYRRLKGGPGRGTLEKEKPPILGILQRDGAVVVRMLENVQQQTIKPLILACVAPGTMVYTDEYDVYRASVQMGIRTQDGMPQPRRIRPRRGWRWLPRGLRQHDGRLLVAATLLAAPPPGHLAGETPALPRFLPVRA